MSKQPSIATNSETRRKMCEHCAFRNGSLELSNPDGAHDFISSCLHKIFWCHETMYQKNPDQSKWVGSFDPTKKRDGSPAKMSDHQVCAGFALMFGSEFGLDTSDIPTENHHFCGKDK